MKKFKFTYTQLIVLSFFGVIAAGGLLLMLPISSADGEWSSPIEAFFTSVSSTCVTGLVVVDTYTHWSLFGQVVVILLIQIGGLGFMTVMSAFFLITGRKMRLRNRSLLMHSTGAISRSGIMRLLRRILIGTALIEGLGAALLSIRFIPRMGVVEGLWNAVFHSISAFCNAGFDIMGKYEQFSSFTSYVEDPLVSFTLAALIIIGGIGFFVWSDIAKNGFNFKRYHLHTKIVVSTTAVLVLGGWLLFYLFERDGQLADLSPTGKAVASLFMSVTPRTAGFNTVNMADISTASVLLTVIFMFIGGSPGSTAGGIKTTTAAALVLESVAAAFNRDKVTVFKRRLADSTLKRASAVCTIYLLATAAAVLALCVMEPYGLEQILLEVVSAIGTVGLTMGITPSLCVASKLILMFLMFMGRVGGLSLVLVLGEKSRVPATERPKENILIG